MDARGNILIWILAGSLIFFGLVGGYYLRVLTSPTNVSLGSTTTVPNTVVTAPIQSNLDRSSVTNTNKSTGLIIIKKGTDGEEYAKKLALQKGWDFTIVDTADYQQIKEIVRAKYHLHPFEYLLLIGSNEEIPLAVYDPSITAYQTDPSLYGDVDNDGLVDLAVGRLPFSSKDQLQKYFTDLVPKGETITFENYPFVVERIDPSDSMLVLDYSYANSCVVPLAPSFRAFRMSDTTNLVKHYYESAVIELRTHGSDDGISPTTKYEWPPNFTIDGFKNSRGNLPYFDNRPIIVHMSCNNAKVLGSQLMENGASAFLGFYNPSGYAPMATQQLLAGKSVGEAMKDMNNAMILRFVRPPFRDYTGGLEIFNFPGLNTFDITDLAVANPVPKDTFGFVLFGDPSLKLPVSFQKESTLKTDYTNNQLTIRALPAKKYAASPEQDLLCYTGSAISDPSFVLKNLWDKSHRLMLTFPVQGMNKLLSYSLYVGGKKLEPGNETVNLALVKGKNTQYIIGFIEDYKHTDTQPVSRFDNSKELKIVVNYE